MKSLIFALLLFSVFKFQVHAESKPLHRPNVLFIMIDDLGWKDVSYMGSTFYETPNIDLIARNGVSFKNAYTASPLCSATRASIITGTWPARNGITAAAGHERGVRYTSKLSEKPQSSQKAIETISASRIRPEVYTLAEAFKDSGYITAHLGKWHIGEEPSDPLSQGFDVDIPHTNAPGPLGDGWFAPWPVWKGMGKEGDHLEDQMAKEASKFIVANNPRKTGKPFLLNYWAFSVHSPWHAKQELIDKYEKKADHFEAQHSALYAAMIETMDHAVGKLIKTLKQENLIEDTIIIFYSDNGGWYLGSNKHVHPDYINTPIGSNYPLRNGKASIYEGGTRVPLVISWPGKIMKGFVNEKDIVTSVDIYPTLLEMCGINPKQDVKFDGISIFPTLKGEHLERDEIYCHFPHYISRTRQVPSTYVRKGHWKLIKYYHDGPRQENRYELYNLHQDIGETFNLADAYPDKVRSLDQLIEKHLMETGGIIPIANPNYSICE